MSGVHRTRAAAGARWKNCLLQMGGQDGLLVLQAYATKRAQGGGLTMATRRTGSARRTTARGGARKPAAGRATARKTAGRAAARKPAAAKPSMRTVRGFGSVFRMVAKPGMKEQLKKTMTSGPMRAPMAGIVSVHFFEGAGDEAWGVAVFRNEKAYRDNANSPEQNKRYQEYRR